MEEKKKWPDTAKYRWQQMTTLTKAEGVIMDEILSRYNCPNISQFCKKIVYGTISLSSPDTMQEDTNAALKVRLAECERTIADIKEKLNP